MANTPVFTLLCSFQFVIGFLMIAFGVVDRVKVKFLFSYVMLPIWIGALAFIAGLSGILIGNQHRNRGFLASHVVSGLRAINILCAAVSFVALYCYTLLFATVATMVALAPNTEISRQFETKEGITAVIMILSVAEMFCGIWLALFNKEGIFVGSTPPI